MRTGRLLVAELLLACTALSAGCAWRMDGVEHYVGPVLFRYRPGDGTRGTVSQVVRPGVWVEAGDQWGITAGVAERVAGAPSPPGERAPRWMRPWSPFDPPEPERWNVSLLYLRVEAAPDATLILRRLYGAEVTLGSETRAVSVGWTSRALIHPPSDAVSMLRFDSRRPLDTVIVTWPQVTEEAPDMWRALEEGRP